MKTNVLNGIKFVVFITIVLNLMSIVGEVLIPENGDKRFQGLTYTIKGYEKLPKNSLDVLFVGDSSLLRSVSPMEIWDKEGIASYNYSVSSVRMYGIYYFVKETLKTQKPKVVVIDPVTVFYHYEPIEELQRIQADYLKNDLVKLEMVNDEHFKNDFLDKVSYFYPILRYHSRWKEFEFSEFEKLTRDYSSISRGFIMSYAVKPNKIGNTYMDKEEENVEFKDDADEYILKINELCKKNNAKLLILGLQDVRVWNNSRAEKMKQFAEENNIDLVDLNTIDYGINWDEDTKDEGIHLNILGALKTSDYVATYLKDNYNLPDHRGEADYEFWNDDYKEYKTYRDKFIISANRLIKKNSQ